MQRLRPSSFCRSWWKLEKLVHGREKNLDFVKISHEGPNEEPEQEAGSNGKGKEKSLAELEETTTIVPVSKKTPL